MHNPVDRVEGNEHPTAGGRVHRWWYLLFVVQFVGLLWPGLYNWRTPELIGIPFFYWYQLLCVLLCSLLTTLIYLGTRKPGEPGHPGS